MNIKNILVSQPEPTELEKTPYGEISRKFKVNIEFRKFIRIEGISASEFRKDKVYIQDHTAIIFTSRNAVDHFFRIAKELRVEIPDTMKYFCISEATAFYLQKYVQYRKRKIFHGKQSFEDMLEVIVKHKDETFLLPCSDIHKLSLPRMLEQHKIKYSKAIIYKTIASDLSDMDISRYDMLIFFSPAGVKSLIKNFPDFKQNSTVIGAFGPSTTRAVKEAGLKLDIPAPTKTALSMTHAIEDYLQKISKNNTLRKS
ncbi:MAG: uroporphyrinogen-III synthase [Bacteroidales bacterium]|nr:uroporphyrinogen-III synthase [Bacteroidales bacterium]